MNKKDPFYIAIGNPIPQRISRIPNIDPENLHHVEDPTDLECFSQEIHKLLWELLPSVLYVEGYSGGRRAKIHGLEV